MKKVTACLLALSALGVFADALPMPENGVMTLSVASGSVTYSDAIPSGVTNIVKIGGGTAVLAGGSGSYAGTVVIRAGTLETPPESLGRPTQVTVENGGCIHLTGKTAFNKETKFSIVGTGPDGSGAMKSSNTLSTGGHVIQRLELTGDAMINCSKRSQFGAGTWDMHGHTLTVKGTDMFSMRSGTITINEPGDIVQAGTTSGGRLAMEVVTLKQGTGDPISSKTIHVGTNGWFMLYGGHTSAAPLQYNVHTSTNAVINAGIWTAATVVNSNYNHIAGSLRLDGDLLFNSYDNVLNDHVWFDGGISGTGRLKCPNGNNKQTIVIGGAHTNEFAGIQVENASVVRVCDDVVLPPANNRLYYLQGGSLAEPATLSLEGNAQLLGRGLLAETNTLRVGCASSSYGLLKIGENAVVSNDVLVSYNGGSNGGFGAIYLLGGQLHMRQGQGGGNNAFVGHRWGYAYLGIRDGLFTEDVWFNLGAWESHSFFFQKGGRVHHAGTSEPVRLGRTSAGTYAHYRQEGGTAKFDNYMALCMIGGVAGGGCTSVFSLDGTETFCDFGSQSVRMYTATNVASAALQTGIVAVNGGARLRIAKIYRDVETSFGTWAACGPYAAQKCPFYLSFDGGTIVASSAGEFFDAWTGQADALRLPSRATIYSRGFAIDTDGKNVTWRLPLTRPTGRVLTRVTLPDAMKTAKALLGPTRATITGAGTGADVIVDFDERTRTATGATIVSPGCDYDENTTVTFQNASRSGTYTATVETAPADVTGGFTKKGAGTLTLTAANTYGGATRLEDGTLAFTHADGLPAGDLEFSATALASGDKAQPLLTALSLPAVDGRKIRVTEAEKLDRDTFGKIRVAATFTTAPAALPAVEFVDSDGAPIDMPAWAFTQSNGGRTLNFGYCRGTVVILK